MIQRSRWIIANLFFFFIELYLRIYIYIFFKYNSIKRKRKEGQRCIGPLIHLDIWDKDLRGERRGNDKGLVSLTKNSITSNVMSKKVYMPRDKGFVSLTKNSITSNVMNKKVPCIEWAMGCVCIYIYSLNIIQ